MLILLFSALTVITAMTGQFYLAKQRLMPVYILFIMAAVFALISNTAVFLFNRENYGILMFHILSIWQIWTSVLGIYRLTKQKSMLVCNNEVKTKT